MYSIVDRILIHLGYAIASFIQHQSHDPRIVVISVDLYIIRLLRDVGVLTSTNEMERVGGSVPLSMKTLRAIGIVQR